MKADLGIPARDFAMNPSRGLMVLFKGEGEDVVVGRSFLFFLGGEADMISNDDADD